MNEEFTTNQSSTSPGGEATLESSKQHALQAAEELRNVAESKARDIKDAAEARANDLKDAATAKAKEFRDAAGERADQFKGFAEQSWSEARDRAFDWKTDGEQYVRENPTKAVLTALGIGFFVGLLLRK